MVDSGYVNTLGRCVSNDNFMDTMKFLDFPMENLEGGEHEEKGEDGEEEWIDWNAKLQSALGPLPVEFLSRCLNENIDNGGSGLISSGSSTLTNESETELTPSPHLNENTSNKSEATQPPLSPISVLDDSRPLAAAHIPRRARSKRSRPATKVTRTFIYPGREIKKKKKTPEKKTITLGGQDSSKRCSHCQVTQTPQWRLGPMGPKTLCNACGVRYRSGRLFPEYRPMASPGFVPSLHSNSHKKVIEMRNKGVGENAAPIPPHQRVKRAPAYKREDSPPPEFIPMSGYLLDCVLGSEVFNY